MKKTVITIISIVLLLAVVFILFFAIKCKDTLRFSQLTSEQQYELSKEVNTIMGGQCEIESIQRNRIGGQAQVTYYYITIKCDSINTLLPMDSERSGSGYYYDGDKMIVRILGDTDKEEMANLVYCLEKSFY